MFELPGHTGACALLGEDGLVRHRRCGTAELDAASAGRRSRGRRDSGARSGRARRRPRWAWARSSADRSASVRCPGTRGSPSAVRDASRGQRRPRRMPGSPASTTVQRRQPVPVLARGAEHHLVRAGAPEVQVRGILPGEADAAVNLDVRFRRVAQRLGAHRLGHARAPVRFAGGRSIRIVERLEGRLRGRPRPFEVDQHVGALVLDGLKAADLPAELFAGTGVVGGDLEHPFARADLFGRQHRQRHVDVAVDDVADGVRRQTAARAGAELSVMVAIGRVPSSTRSASATTPSTVGSSRNTAGSPSSSMATTTRSSAAEPPEHVAHCAVDTPAVTSAGGAQRHRGRTPQPAVAGESRRGSAATFDEPGEPLVGVGVVARSGPAAGRWPAPWS